MAHPGLRMPSPPPAEKIATPSAVDVTMSISQQTLKILQTAGQYVPVPAIGVAATVAVSILGLVQTMKDNKAAFIDIGKDACTIVMTVVQRVNLSATGQAPPIDDDVLKQDGMLLLGEMQAIEKCVTKQVKKRSLVKRIVFSQSDQEVVKECQKRLQRALNLFGLQSDLEMRKQLAELSAQMKELLQHHKLQSHAPQMPQPQMPQPQIPQPQIPQAQNPPILIPQTYLPQSPHPSNQSKEDSKAARRARREARNSQQVIDTGGPGFPSDSTFQNVQNHISPGGNINYSYIAGNLSHNVRDDSFNVGGANNSINISFTR